MAGLLREPDIEIEDGRQATDPQIANIRKEWDWVKKGIEEVIAGIPHSNYRAEDVYAACVSGEAQLWTTNEGFLVTTADEDSFTQEAFCFIWVAWAKNRGRSYALKHRVFFAQKAKDAGFDGLRLKTSHEELKPYLTSCGFELDSMQFTERFNG
jgi:hypothetical protein